MDFFNNDLMNVFIRSVIAMTTLPIDIPIT